MHTILGGRPMMMMIRVIFALCVLLPTSSWATLWYVDNTASGSNNGTSWTNAWTSIATLVANWASVNPGDTVYISGGSVSKTYNEAFTTIKSGTAGNVITVSTGQDANHNGTVIINPGSSSLMPTATLSYFHLTGNVGGLQKMQVTGTYFIFNNRPVINVPQSYVRLSYIDFGARNYGWYQYGSLTTVGFEFDHNNLEKTTEGTGVAGDSVIEGMGSWNDNNTWDDNLIHHNTFTLHNDYITGPDLIKWGAGISFYENTVTVVSDGCGSNCGQHSDFFQINKSYFKIYNNRFTGSHDSVMLYSGFGVGSGNPVHDLYFYNNILDQSAQIGGVSDGPTMVLFSELPHAVSNVAIVNNTFVDWNPDPATKSNVLAGIAGFSSCTECRVQNNLFKGNTATNQFNNGQGVTVSNNTTQNSAVQFASYAQYATSTNDYRLAAADTVAKDQGVDLSSLCVGALVSLCNDKDGVARPVGAAWDIGAYEYGAPPVPAQVTGFHAANFTGSTWAMLIWHPSTDTDLAGYNVYRCTASGACSNRIANITFASAAAARQPATQWFDHKLYTAGTYYYTVAPFNSSLVVGTISSEIAVTVTGRQ